MSNFQNMKIRFEDSKHKAQVLEALENLGYDVGRDTKYTKMDIAFGAYTYEGSAFVLYSSVDSGQGYFNDHNNPEYVLTPQGTFMKVEDYYKTPQTPDKDGAASLPPPIGLIPRYAVEAKRLQEILEAMHRYSVAGKVIPKVWSDELAELLKRQQQEITLEFRGIV
jgi:hypothetical protein